MKQLQGSSCFGISMCIIILPVNATQMHTTTLHTNLTHMPNLGGIADGEQPCKHSGVAINGQDPKHPGQPQQGKEDDSGLEGGPVGKRVKECVN